MSESQVNDILARLYEDYYRIVYNYCLMKINFQMRFSHVADDCVQDAFIEYMLSYTKLQEHPNPVGWLCETAWNRMRSAIRKSKREDLKLDEMGQHLDADTLQIESAFERWLNKEESVFQLEKIYHALTDIERKVFDSYFVDDLSMEKAAEENGISKNSVRSAVDRIRKRVRKE